MLTQLAAQNFRNIQSLEWKPASGSHLLLGENGAGKTSLLEAIHVLGTTRSFRTSQIQDCLQHGKEQFTLRGEVDKAQRTTLEVTFQGTERLRLVNGKPTTLADHLTILPVVAWTSASEAPILVGPPSARRRFLDRGVVGLRPAALDTLGRYREALLQKRLLLQGGIAGIDAWNEVLATEAAALIQERSRYVALLHGQLQLLLERSGLLFPPIEIRYRSSPPDGIAGRDRVLRAVEKLVEVERRRRMPLAGPHRDELEILWGGHEIRRVASAGERKALSLLMLAAHAAVLQAAGRAPLILLDDADAELAPQTVAAVWRIFKDAPQVLVTSNRPQVWLTLEIGKLWEVAEGALQPLA